MSTDVNPAHTQPRRVLLKPAPGAATSETTSVIRSAILAQLRDYLPGDLP